MAVIGVTSGAFDGNIANAMRNMGFNTMFVDELSDVSDVDGLILSGGEDVHPARYGEKMSNLIFGANLQRDELEFSAVATAFNSGIPVMGICRGHQVIGVYHGFKLIQDISYNHMKLGGFGWRDQTHPIYGLEEYGKGVNSLHHQAVPNDSPEDKGVEVLALADDDKTGDRRIIEAMRSPRFVSCQWHPELDWSGVPVSKMIFSMFADMVRA